MMAQPPNSNSSDEDDNFYLSKILFFTFEPLEFVNHLKHYHNDTDINSSCLETIGMFPFISRVETNLGMFCLSNWIINSERRFSQFRLPYYAGASHSIVLCMNEFEQENINELLTIVPQGIPVTIITMGENSIDINTLPQFIQEGLSADALHKVEFKQIEQLESISDVFNEIGQDIAQSIVTGRYETYIPDRTKENTIKQLFIKRSLNKIKELVGEIGFELSDDGKVTVAKPFFTYEINFFRNSVTANVTSCLSCDNDCKHYRKLCVEIEEDGFSNNGYIESLHAIAILYALYENRLTSLKGEKKRDAVAYQLERLKSLYETNCKILKEEQADVETFLKMTSKEKKSKSKKK